MRENSGRKIAQGPAVSQDASSRSFGLNKVGEKEKEQSFLLTASFQS